VIENLQNRQFPKLRNDILLRREDFGLVVLDPKSDTVFQTNLVGAEILLHCNELRSLPEISRLIADTFEIEEEIACEDVKNFFLKLAEFNLIEYV
jgi:hypothetical protein